MKERIKNCPFCGSSDLWMPDGFRKFVGCNGCGCRGPMTVMTGGGVLASEEDVVAHAIEAWNRAIRRPNYGTMTDEEMEEAGFEV